MVEIEVAVETGIVEALTAIEEEMRRPQAY